MEYVRLGRSGLRISRLGLGMMSYGDPAGQSWALDEERAEPIVRGAVEAGFTFFDTADSYSGGASEEITGRLLNRMFRRRDDYVLATKVFFPTGSGPNDRGLSRKHIMAGVEASLRRLGTDHIDLYQIHRWDDATPIEETMSALHDVVQAGKVRYIGASTMAGWQFAKAHWVARLAGTTSFVSMQNRYNLVNREDERELVPLCADIGVGLVPYSPLARGLLAGKRTGARTTPRAAADDHEYRAADLAVADAVAAVAGRHGRTPPTIALAWLLGRPPVAAPIIGATARHHVDDAVAALDVVLDPGDVAALEAPYEPHRPGEFT
jgi:aryl-alcohol dehydrogenase-like predicted oxidoreductase